MVLRNLELHARNDDDDVLFQLEMTMKMGYQASYESRCKVGLLWCTGAVLVGQRPFLTPSMSPVQAPGL